MATFSYALYPGDGTTTNFVIPFPYLDPAHILVKVDGVSASFSFLNANTIKLATPAPNGKVVEIRRATVQATAPVDFTDGSVLREVDLDKLVLFATYAAQESIDTQLRTIYQKGNGDYTAGGFRLADLADPVNMTDAVNRQYFENVYTPQMQNLLSQANAAKSAAQDSASSASTSKSNAATSETNAANTLAAFKRQYQGSLATAPTARYDSSPLQIGDLYFNTAENAMKVYGSSGWINAGSSVNGIRKIQSFTATPGQSLFTIPGGYDAGFVEVFVNGWRLSAADIDTSSGSTVSLLEACSGGELVDIICYGAFSLAGTYTKAETDAAVAKVKSDTDAAVAKVGTAGYRNRLINGEFRISQRAGGAVMPVTTTGYTLDRWRALASQASKFSVQQGAAVTVGSESFGASASCISAGVFSPAATDYFIFDQPIEADNITDLRGQDVVVSFLSCHDVPGKYAVTYELNGRAMCKTYTHATAGVWQWNEIVFPADSSPAAVVAGNGYGGRVAFDLGSGTNYETATEGVWSSTFFARTNGCVKLIGQAANSTCRFAAVQLEKGSKRSLFEKRLYPIELLLCQRYYEMGYVNMRGYGNAGDVLIGWLSFHQTKRTASTISLWNITGVNAYSLTATSFNSDGFGFRYYASAAGQSEISSSWGASAEL